MAAMRHCRLGCLAVVCLLAGLGATAYAGSASPSIAAFDHAQRLRQNLEAMPEAQRSRIDYERVLNAYREVYHSDPASARADDSIVAVAELLAEEGRVFHSPKAFRDAVGQYEFLRRQYPYSHYRSAALLAEGEIDQTGLADRDSAQAAFEEFLKKYPKNDLAGQARADLTKILQAEALNGAPGRQAPPTAPAITAQKNTPPPEAGDLSPAETANDASPNRTEDPTEDRAENRTEAHAEARRGPAHITAIHYWFSPADTRIAIDLEDQVKYVSARIPRPNRVYFDLRGTRLGPGLKEKSIAIGNDASLTRIRAAQFSPDVTRIVLDVGAGIDYNAFFLPNPWRLVIDLHQPKQSAAPLSASNKEPSHRTLAQLPSTHETASTVSRSSSSRNARPRSHNELDSVASLPLGTSAQQDPSAVPSLADADASAISPDDEELPPAREAVPTAGGERSLARTLGLKVGRIVIDAGHGGHDSGSIGPDGLEEKTVTLDVALRLGRLLKNRLGADVIYTRRTDTFVPLQTRTALANAAHADLFISIHANSSSDPETRGVESYYLNFTTAPDALQVAARENADSDESVANLTDLVKEITLKDKIEESREFAVDVQRALYNGLAPGNPGFKNRGVKKAPFVVLIGANMPSILAEISFLTNPEGARELRQPAYRERIAESLYRGIASYINGLNGVRLAENGVRPN